MSTRNQITKIEERLAELRKDWKKAKPNRKKFIEAGAKLLKDEKARLMIQLENETK